MSLYLVVTLLTMHEIPAYRAANLHRYARSCLQPAAQCNVGGKLTASTNRSLKMTALADSFVQI